MKTFIKQSIGALFLLSSALMGTAYAGACGTTAGLDTNEVTLEGVESDDCAGVFSGNINQLNLNDAGILFGGDPWEVIVEDDPSIGGGNDIDFMGFNFLLEASGDTSGTWTLTLTDPDPADTLPIFVDLGVALKAGDQYAVYLFDDWEFSALGANDGTWSISFTFTNPQGTDIFQDLSHMSLLLRGGECPPDHPDCGEDPDPIPEPTTMWLLGLGLLGLARYYRNQEKSVLKA